MNPVVQCKERMAVTELNGPSAADLGKYLDGAIDLAIFQPTEQRRTPRAEKPARTGQGRDPEACFNECFRRPRRIIVLNNGDQ